ncbi:Ig-like domain-containing protein, partial [Chloroflexota bacterium]
VDSRTPTSAVITWLTDELGDTGLQCGEAPGDLPLEVFDASFSTSHTANLTALSPARTYRCVAQSTDPAGNSAESDALFFEILRPPDTADPTVTLDDPGTLSGQAVLTAAATDDAGISRVIFYQDGLQALMDFGPPYQYPIDTDLFDNGPHLVLARAVDLSGKETDHALEVEFANLKDASWPTVDITHPSQDATVSGIVNVTADLTDDTGILSARFFVDGDYQQFNLLSVGDPPTSATAEFDWDTRGLNNGQSYTLGVVVHDRDSKIEADSVSVVVNNVAPPPPPSPPLLQIANQAVLRNSNRFIVLLTVKNVGDAEARNVRIRYHMPGFQPIAKDDPSVEIRPEYDPVAGSSYADIRPRTSLSAHDSRIYAFYAIPYLLNPDPKTPAFGSLIDIFWDSLTQSGYSDAELLPVGTVVGGDTIPQAHTAAVKTADYLLVTNPWRLFLLYNPTYYQGQSLERTRANDVLSKMAELAYHQQGVLGYNTTYTSESLRDLIKQGGAWGSRLAPGWTSSGYMLLVGEVNILSAWWRNYGSVFASGQDRQLTVSYTDYPYASTYGSEWYPQLSIARIIGDGLADFSMVLGNHIERLKGTAGYEFDGDSTFLASGFSRGVAGESGELHFKPERDKVANNLIGSKTLLHTPDLSVLYPSGELDILATEAAIAASLLALFWARTSSSWRATAVGPVGTACTILIWPP